MIDLRDFVPADTDGPSEAHTAGAPPSQLTGWELAARWDEDDDASGDAPTPIVRTGRGFSAPEVEEDSGDADDDPSTPAEEEDVAYEDRLAYASALEAAWLNHQSTQIAAIREGLGQVRVCVCTFACVVVCIHMHVPVRMCACVCGERVCVLCMSVCAFLRSCPRVC